MTIPILTPRSGKGEPEFLDAQLKAYDEAIAVSENKLRELKEKFIREVNSTNK